MTDPVARLPRDFRLDPETHEEEWSNSKLLHAYLAEADVALRGVIAALAATGDRPEWIVEANAAYAGVWRLSVHADEEKVE